MAVDKNVFLRYRILNRCLRNQYREYTIYDLLDACNAALVRADKSEVSKRTIQNDIATLEKEYGIMLDEKLHRGRKRIFRYTDTDYMLPMFNIDDTERYKIRAAVNVLENYEGEPLYDWARILLMQIQSGLFGSDSSPVVTFQSNPDLKGLSHFSELLKAILTRRVLKLRYTPFGKATISETVYPYHLKQFNDRWYLIAQAVGYTGYGHYALDRINSFKELNLPYKEAEIDFSDYFDDVIGVTVPEDEDAEDIVIKVSRSRYDYIKTKPLHLSQRIIEEAADHAVISINVKINRELVSLILSFGPDIEILAPTDFRALIADKIRAMSQNYSICEENLHSK